MQKEQNLKKKKQKPYAQYATGAGRYHHKRETMHYRKGAIESESRDTLEDLMLPEI